MVSTLKENKLTIPVILLSFCVASMLNVYPLSANVAVFRPMFLIIVLIFWLLYQPKYVGLSVAFAVGLSADLLFDTLLGQQAFCALLSALCVRLGSHFIKRFNRFNTGMLAIISLSVFQVSLLILQFITQSVFILETWWSLLTGILCWPLVTWIFRKYIR